MSEQLLQQPVSFFDSVLRRNLSSQVWDKLQEKINSFTGQNDKAFFYSAFTAMPRVTGKGALILMADEHEKAEGFFPALRLADYTIDRLARVWLVLHYPSGDKETFLNIISELFKAGAVNELVALYGALPVLPYPEELIAQCAEGIRSNIGPVQEAIMHDNPYPATYLPEAAWNQMVLKAFFTDKQVYRIIGLDRRANKTLADTLVDYARERRAAGRTIDPQLWRLVGKFIDEQSFPVVKTILETGEISDRQAAALACAQSSFAPAIDLLKDHAELKEGIEKQTLTWQHFDP